MKKRTRSSIAIAAAFLGASSLCSIATLEGCTIVNGLVADRPDSSTTKITDTGADSDAAGPIANGCAAIPARPTVPDEGTMEVVAVAKKMYLTPQTGAAPVGFDLDESCLLPSSDTCKSPKPVTDDPGGLDNRGAQLFALVNDRTDLEQRANEGIVAGKNGFLFKVAKYNGKSEDYQVEVSIYSALGLLDGGSNVPPKFEETEKWTIDEGQFDETLGVPKILVDGWVVGGKVYAVVGPEASLRLSNTFSVLLSGGVLRLDMDLTGAKPRISGGVVAGRWTARDMIATVSRQRLSDASASAICASGQELILAAAKAQICENVDIMGDRKVDKTGATCDATSVAFAFEAGPAALGPKMPFTPEDDCPGFDAGACQ